MGSGDRAYRIGLGEGRAIQEHEIAMIPIVKQRGEAEIGILKTQAEMELEMGQRAFEQQIEQAEQLDLLANRISDAQPIQPAYAVTMPVPSSPPPPAKPALSKNLIYAGLALGAFLFLRS